MKVRKMVCCWGLTILSYSCCGCCVYYYKTNQPYRRPTNEPASLQAHVRALPSQRNPSLTDGSFICTSKVPRREGESNSLYFHTFHTFCLPIPSMGSTHRRENLSARLPTVFHRPIHKNRVPPLLHSTENLVSCFRSRKREGDNTSRRHRHTHTPRYADIHTYTLL